MIELLKKLFQENVAKLRGENSIQGFGEVTLKCKRTEVGKFCLVEVSLEGEKIFSEICDVREQHSVIVPECVAPNDQLQYYANTLRENGYQVAVVPGLLFFAEFVSECKPLLPGGFIKLADLVLK